MQGGGTGRHSGGRVEEIGDFREGGLCGFEGQKTGEQKYRYKLQQPCQDKIQHSSGKDTKIKQSIN